MSENLKRIAGALRDNKRRHGGYYTYSGFDGSGKSAEEVADFMIEKESEGKPTYLGYIQNLEVSESEVAKALRKKGWGITQGGVWKMEEGNRSRSKPSSEPTPDFDPQVFFVLASVGGYDKNFVVRANSKSEAKALVKPELGELYSDDPRPEFWVETMKQRWNEVSGDGIEEWESSFGEYIEKVPNIGDVYFWGDGS